MQNVDQDILEKQDIYFFQGTNFHSNMFSAIQTQVEGGE